jgi:hypothetical protein
MDLSYTGEPMPAAPPMAARIPSISSFNNTPTPNTGPPDPVTVADPSDSVTYTDTRPPPEPPLH